jgi:GxxExxY protein
VNENELSYLIIGAAIEVHRELGGPGLLESLYEEAICYELSLRGVSSRRQVGLPVVYKGRQLEKNFVIDLLVAETVVVECKHTEIDHPIHQAQCLTHLKLTGKKLGLVINFGQRVVKDGVHRVVNGL